jgi:CsoR family transcriptional regulator, copper-sensing transcriptional repressor
MAEQRNADEARRELVLRLKRAEGQIRGVQDMIEGGQDCEKIAQQLSAARKALDRAFYELMACAIQHPQFSADPRERHDARIERLTRVLARLA